MADDLFFHAPGGTLKICLVTLACCCLPVASLAASDCGVPKPVRPFEGLIDESMVRQGDGTVIADIAGKRVALIVSPNAEKQLAWNESLRQPLTGFYATVTEARGDKEQWEQANREAYDPKALVNRLVAPLVAIARETKAMPDLATFRDSGFELAVVLDINFKCSEDRGFTGATDVSNEIEVAAYPLSPAFMLGPVVRGRSTLRTRYEPGHAEVARWRQDALNLRIAAGKDFEANVSRTYPAKKDGGRPVGALSGSAETPRLESMRARLEAVEDLRKRGLIAEDEAEVKRKEILKGL